MTEQGPKHDWKGFLRAIVIVPVAIVIVPVASSIAHETGYFASLPSFHPTDTTQAWAMVAGVSAAIGALSSVLVAAFAFRALRSLKLTRTEMVNRANREATVSAIQRLEQLASEIIPMNIPILGAMSQHNVQVFANEAEGVKFNPDPTDLREAVKWAAGLPPGSVSDIVGFLNRLEGWCSYFTSGVAAEKIAFEPAGPLLRSWVGQYYPILLLERAERGSGNFPNIVKLYTVWSGKMTEQQLARQHADMVRQLGRQRKQMAEGAQLDRVIGADVDL